MATKKTPSKLKTLAKSKTPAKAKAKSKSAAAKPYKEPGLMKRLSEGAVICAEGYVFELERRGYLQAGAFRKLADAESARAKLALLGFEASVSDRSSDTGVLHRVRMGPYNQVEAMNKVRAKLSENGVDVAVVRNQK